SEDRWGDRKRRTYVGINIKNTSLKTEGRTYILISRKRERERGGEEKSKSRDLSNRSLNRWGDGKRIT
ncbi:hypothetical protein, partial [Thiolapillus sp.]|uniref:hypothetical protein n=1 Tax=Thiolapillus sp. TaxID=2017437 RepID=UPI003AF61635